MLFQGAPPTFGGFFIYGAIVYPGYEIMKRLLFEWVGPAAAIEWRVPLVLSAGAIAYPTLVKCEHALNRLKPLVAASGWINV